jgi:hypothetical protein
MMRDALVILQVAHRLSPCRRRAFLRSLITRDGHPA